ncbi:hypothetical protein K388_05584 [Streptomyces sp. KhCrAH-43]|uniref:hypothetical protein n=1 Tax=unclassified Streptomyces TaxID=2593676 RepID=UPI00037D7148|nr:MULTISPECIES: hypothetical protein [unclassified Streptomyces]MYX67357.1 hypothetical protein [Streptomyces sp. SID8373]RAJ53797.1 hypothetical protein K388_05584 [Streptomyces sp. KhCrAH-43]
MSKPNRKVIRLQQMRAQRASVAKTQFVDVVFENADGVDEVCTFPVQDNWPLEVIEQVEEMGGNTNLNVLREIATPKEAFDRLVKVAHLTVGELKDIIEEMDGEAGTTQGEDSGSSPSSESTLEPSVPTSSGTTPAAA